MSWSKLSFMGFTLGFGITILAQYQIKKWKDKKSKEIYPLWLIHLLFNNNVHTNYTFDMFFDWVTKTDDELLQDRHTSMREKYKIVNPETKFSGLRHQQLDFDLSCSWTPSLLCYHGQRLAHRTHIEELYNKYEQSLQTYQSTISLLQCVLTDETELPMNIIERIISKYITYEDKLVSQKTCSQCENPFFSLLRV